MPLLQPAPASPPPAQRAEGATAYSSPRTQVTVTSGAINFQSSSPTGTATASGSWQHGSHDDHSGSAAMRLHDVMDGAPHAGCAAVPATTCEPSFSGSALAPVDLPPSKAADSLANSGYPGRTADSFAFSTPERKQLPPSASAQPSHAAATPISGVEQAASPGTPASASSPSLSAAVSQALNYGQKLNAALAGFPQGGPRSSGSSPSPSSTFQPLPTEAPVYVQPLYGGAYNDVLPSVYRASPGPVPLPLEDEVLHPQANHSASALAPAQHDWPAAGPLSSTLPADQGREPPPPTASASTASYTTIVQKSLADAFGGPSSHGFSADHAPSQPLQPDRTEHVSAADEGELSPTDSGTAAWTAAMAAVSAASPTHHDGVPPSWPAPQEDLGRQDENPFPTAMLLTEPLPGFSSSSAEVSQPSTMDAAPPPWVPTPYQRPQQEAVMGPLAALDAAAATSPSRSPPPSATAGGPAGGGGGGGGRFAWLFGTPTARAAEAAAEDNPFLPATEAEVAAPALQPSPEALHPLPVPAVEPPTATAAPSVSGTTGLAGAAGADGSSRAPRPTSSLPDYEKRSASAATHHLREDFSSSSSAVSLSALPAAIGGTYAADVNISLYSPPAWSPHDPHSQQHGSGAPPWQEHSSAVVGTAGETGGRQTGSMGMEAPLPPGLAPPAPPPAYSYPSLPSVSPEETVPLAPLVPPYRDVGFGSTELVSEPEPQQQQSPVVPAVLSPLTEVPPPLNLPPALPEALLPPVPPSAYSSDAPVSLREPDIAVAAVAAPLVVAPPASPDSLPPLARSSYRPPPPDSSLLSSFGSRSASSSYLHMLGSGREGGVVAHADLRVPMLPPLPAARGAYGADAGPSASFLDAYLDNMLRLDDGKPPAAPRLSNADGDDNGEPEEAEAGSLRASSSGSAQRGEAGDSRAQPEEGPEQDDLGGLPRQQGGGFLLGNNARSAAGGIPPKGPPPPAAPAGGGAGSVHRRVESTDSFTSHASG